MNDPQPPPRRRRRAFRVLGISAAVLLAGLGIVAATFSPSWILTPRADFDPAASPPSPDYTQDGAWAALPSTDDHTDLVLDGQVAAGYDAPADAFYVHPTTYFSRAGWNAPIDEPVSTELLDEVVLASEASAFNGCCRIFAPRYRQATLGTFYASPENAQLALDLAYQDVAAAFEAFLERAEGRPFILAGHSQGSLHLTRLLQRVDDDPDLRARLVAAYLPGFAVPEDQYGEVWTNLQACDGPTQTGCIAAWDTYREGARVGGTKPLFHWRGTELVKIPPEAPRQCTNPVTWRDGGSASAIDHLGATTPRHRGEPPGFISLLMATEPLGFEVLGLSPHPDLHVDARCDHGVLRVPELGPLGFPEQETEPGNYHLHDYELFHADIRANAKARVEAWLAAPGR